MLIYLAELRTYRSLSAFQLVEEQQTTQNLAILHFLDLQLLHESLHLLLYILLIPSKFLELGPKFLSQLHTPLFHFQLVEHLHKKDSIKSNVMNKMHHALLIKVNTSPKYDLYVGECLLERSLVLGHWHLRYGGGLLSLLLLSPWCFHWVPICCWVDSSQAFSHRF